MIVLSAQDALENNKPENYTPEAHPQWGYLALKIKDNVYRIVFEYNQFYGDLVRQWSIDGNVYSTVKCKYDTLDFLKFDCSNGSIGIRKFEKDCFAWEFLYKPIGIPEEDIFNRPNKEVGMWSNELKKILSKNNIKFEIIKEGIY